MKWKSIWFPLGTLLIVMGILSVTSAALKPTEDQNRAEEQQRTLELLLPGSQNFEPEEYKGEDAYITGLFKGETGYVVETAVEGYVDDIVLWVGVKEDGTVTGVTVREMAETWGVGSKAMTDISFLSQFLNGTGNAAAWENIDVLTGATVTSKAVIKAVNSAAAFITGVDAPSEATEWGG